MIIDRAIAKYLPRRDEALLCSLIFTYKLFPQTSGYDGRLIGELFFLTSMETSI